MTDPNEHRPFRSARMLSIVIAIVALVGCDRVTKTIAQYELQDASSRSYLMETVRLQYVENEGAFLGIGSELPKWFRLGFSFLLLVVTCAAFVLLLAKAKDLRRLQNTAFTLMLAGGYGNLYDRLTNDGRVIDFMVVILGPVRTGIFNAADVCITFGVLLILLDAVIHKGAFVEGESVE